ncbi:hypothetical protein JMUB6875_51470 [Nocardia sp. JMUB6875]
MASTPPTIASAGPAARPPKVRAVTVVEARTIGQRILKATSRCFGAIPTPMRYYDVVHDLIKKRPLATYWQ